MFYNIAISGLSFYLILAALSSAEEVTDICSNFCGRLDYEGTQTDCVIVCESLLVDQLKEADGAEDEAGEVGDKRGFHRVTRPKSSFVRIGREPEKRASAFVRIGKSLDHDIEQAKRKSSFIRIGRPSSFVRIGKSLDGDDAKRSSSFVRIGRPSSFVRIGKSLGQEDKRKSSFIRIGKKDDDFQDAYEHMAPYEYADYDKLANFIEHADLNVPAQNALEEKAKRVGSFVRIGKSLQDNEDEKRSSHFVRIGKASNFVRIGKSVDANESPIAEAEKRKGSFVRIGKSSDNPASEVDKRKSSFVRIG